MNTNSSTNQINLSADFLELVSQLRQSANDDGKIKSEQFPLPLFISTKQFQFLLGLEDDHAIRHSRTTGYLLGRPSPEYIKMGRIVRYPLTTTLKWIEQFLDPKQGVA